MGVSAFASLSDGELARRISEAESGAARSEEAELCARFAPRVNLYGRRHLKNRDRAADLAQRVMLLTIVKLRERAVDNPDKIASFVLGAARLLSLQMKGRESREDPVRPDLLVDLAPMLRSPYEPLPREALARCVEGLGERERSVVFLTFFQDEAAKDVAAALGMTEGNVRVVRHRAIERLRNCLGFSREVEA